MSGYCRECGNQHCICDMIESNGIKPQLDDGRANLNKGDIIMQPYYVLANEKLKGETPQEKYDNLMAMCRLLKAVAFPRRGTAEETMDIMDVAREAAKYVEQFTEYE